MVKFGAHHFSSPSLASRHGPIPLISHAVVATHIQKKKKITRGRLATDVTSGQIFLSKKKKKERKKERKSHKEQPAP